MDAFNERFNVQKDGMDFDVALLGRYIQDWPKRILQSECPGILVTALFVDENYHGHPRIEGAFDTLRIIRNSFEHSTDGLNASAYTHYPLDCRTYDWLFSRLGLSMDTAVHMVSWNKIVPTLLPGAVAFARVFENRLPWLQLDAKAPSRLVQSPPAFDLLAEGRHNFIPPEFSTQISVPSGVTPNKVFYVGCTPQIRGKSTAFADRGVFHHIIQIAVDTPSGTVAGINPSYLKINDIPKLRENVGRIKQQHLRFDVDFLPSRWMFEFKAEIVAYGPNSRFGDFAQDVDFVLRELKKSEINNRLSVEAKINMRWAR